MLNDNKKKNVLLELFFSFFRIGAFTFGGGYAMIPLIQKEVVDNKRWLEEKDIMDVVAIAETTPGPIAINSATFVGFKVNGVKGAAVSTLGVVLPSFFIITLISLLFTQFMGETVIANAFWGIRIGVLALMAKALITMFKQCPKNAVSYGIAFIALILVAVFNINVLIIIVLAAIIGIIYNCIKKENAK